MKNKPKPIGYIACDSDWRPAHLGSYNDTPRGGVLLIHGTRATVFATRARAQSAINRTEKYAESKDYPWGKYRIVQLEQSP